MDSALERSPIAKERRKPMSPRKFGYDVSVCPKDRPYRLWEREREYGVSPTRGGVYVC